MRFFLLMTFGVQCISVPPLYWYGWRDSNSQILDSKSSAYASSATPAIVVRLYYTLIFVVVKEKSQLPPPKWEEVLIVTY